MSPVRRRLFRQHDRRDNGPVLRLVLVRLRVPGGLHDADGDAMRRRVLLPHWYRVRHGGEVLRRRRRYRGVVVPDGTYR